MFEREQTAQKKVLHLHMCTRNLEAAEEQSSQALGKPSALSFSQLQKMVQRQHRLDKNSHTGRPVLFMVTGVVSCTSIERETLYTTKLHDEDIKTNQSIHTER